MEETKIISKSANTEPSWALVNSDQAVFFCLLGLLYHEGEGNTLVRRGSMYRSTMRNNQEYFSALLQAT
jgi:hypothetical protein